MKHFFLFLLFFIPLHFFAQDYYDQFLTADAAKANKIKVQKITTYFSRYPSGFSSHRDSTALDTAVLEMHQYDQNGNIILKTYSVPLDKSNYSSHAEYFYNPDGQLTRTLFHQNDSLIDSMIVVSQPPHFVTCDYYQSYRVIHDIEGDSVLIEKRISGHDTIIHTHKLINRDHRSHWDDEFTDDYNHKTIHRDTIRRVDSCTFYNEKGKIILTIVDRYDSLNHVTCSDYYNRRDPDFRIYSTRYNGKNNMTTYMPANKKGKLTYRIIRIYDSQGLLSEVKHIPVQKRIPITDIKFDYTHY